MMDDISGLIKRAAEYKNVFVQTHNFPDHDALAAAYGLQSLLENYGVKSRIIYGGDITRASITNMIEALGINAESVCGIKDTAGDAVIMVDGCRGNNNMKELKNASLIGVIDHHDTSHAEEIAFCDIRPRYGSCSTIIFTYFERLGVKITRETATALLIGLCVDTAILMRNIVEDDVRAYFHLFSLADNSFVQSMVRNYIETRDLAYYKQAIENIKIEGDTAFCYLKEGCSQNLLGIMADFFLALEEVTFVMLCAKNDGKIIFSLRSENEKYNAADMIQALLKGRGFGGGHHNMAGGIMNEAGEFDENLMFGELKDLIKAASELACSRKSPSGLSAF